MNILIVCQYYYPEQFQINDIAPELVKRGHDVTVLTGLPNYPQGEIYQGYENGKKRNEIVNGVRIIRVEEHPRKNGIRNLILNYISFAGKGLKEVKKLTSDYDIVFCYQLSPVTMVIPAAAYAKKFGKPLLLYCLDIWPESAKDHLNLPLIYDLIGRLSRNLYRKCDHICVTSRPFIDYFKSEIGYDENKMSYIPQHADASMLNQNLETEKKDGIINFMYAGNMGKGQTLDVIIRAVAELKEKNSFVVHMVGDGSKRKELELLSKDLGVSGKIIFHGNQKRDNMPEFYKNADVLLISLRGNNAVGNTMPGKLQMYMTTGKPILGAISGAANEVIRESACGGCVPSGDYAGLAGLMADFIDHPQKYADCGKKGRAYFKKHFTLEQYMNSLEDLLYKLEKENEV